MKSAVRTEKSSGELAELTGGRLAGPDDVIVSGVAGLEEATPQDVSFLSDRGYLRKATSSTAGVILVPEDYREESLDRIPCRIMCGNPSDAFSRIVEIFAPPPIEYPPGIHPSATLHASASVPESAHVGARAVIERDVSVGKNTVVCAGCCIGPETVIGDDCTIFPNVVIRERCALGNRVIINSGAVIGSDGFGFIPDFESGNHRKIPQVGTVQIDDDVEIGSLTAVDRARFGKTWIKQGVKIDNLVQVAHNVVIGESSFIIAQTGISGSCRIGRCAVLGGQVGVTGHLKIGDHARVMARSTVTGDVKPGTTVFGTPAKERRRYARIQMQLKQLGRYQERVRQLEKKLDQQKD